MVTSYGTKWSITWRNAVKKLGYSYDTALETICAVQSITHRSSAANGCTVTTVSVKIGLRNWKMTGFCKKAMSILLEIRSVEHGICRRHPGFMKFQIFNGLDAQECRTAPACQILSKSVEPRPRYGHFPLTKPVAVNTGLALPRSLWYFFVK